MFSATMLPPVAVSLFYDDGMHRIFVNAFAITFVIGFVLWVIFFRWRADMRIKDGFLITVFFYLALGIFGALPFLDERGLGLSIPDALFESFSGLTTTGATIIVGLDRLPESILFYRQQLQWLGGMGIIVLAVAILPMLVLAVCSFTGLKHRPCEGFQAHAKNQGNRAGALVDLSGADRHLRPGLPGRRYVGL